MSVWVALMRLKKRLGPFTKGLFIKWFEMKWSGVLLKQQQRKKTKISSISLQKETKEEKRPRWLFEGRLTENSRAVVPKGPRPGRRWDNKNNSCTIIHTSVALSLTDRNNVKEWGHSCRPAIIHRPDSAPSRWIQDDTETNLNYETQ